ncbi:hypothetical protein VRY54_01145 [Actinomyces sp. F1_1611]
MREPILYPNWVWVLSVTLVVVSLAVTLALLVAYRRSQVRPELVLRSLDQRVRERYLRQIAEVEAGHLGAREAHLALSALIRAAASERLRANVEAMTVAEVQAVGWPALTEALRWCEPPSFGAVEPPAQLIETGLTLARRVVEQ